MRRLTRVVGLVLLLMLAPPPAAFAVDPPTQVGGSGSKWFSGSLLQMEGDNCSIIGNTYTETMVSAIAGYGGASGGQVVKVGDRYYASVLISVPGNPCGSGSSLVATDIFLPRGTSVDTTAPIRCFGQPRGASTFGELTGGNWSFQGSSGSYCPTRVGPSQTGAPGTIGVGYRLLASGQMFYLFVPIKSTQTLEGAAHSPADEIHWFIGATGAYVSPQATSVWVNVFPSGSGSGPFIYFARDPSVVPYFDPTAPSTPVDTRYRVELFANLYSAGLPGQFCWDLYSGATATGSPIVTCSDDGTWNASVTAGPDSWQVSGNGPNGGYSNLYFDPAATYTIRWKFTYNGGANVVFKDVTFTTLVGPDSDGDGVPDSLDACPTVKGTQANGCPAPKQVDPDHDGVFGSADKCPTVNGRGSLNGCPPFAASLRAIAGNRLKRSALVKGVSLPVSCNLDSTATAALKLSRTVAKKLKIRVAPTQRLVTIAAASARCTRASGGKLTLKLSRALAAKVLKPRKPVVGTLVVVFSRPWAKPITVQRALKLI